MRVVGRSGLLEALAVGQVDFRNGKVQEALGACDEESAVTRAKLAVSCSVLQSLAESGRVWQSLDTQLVRHGTLMEWQAARKTNNQGHYHHHAANVTNL